MSSSSVSLVKETPNEARAFRRRLSPLPRSFHVCELPQAKSGKAFTHSFRDCIGSIPVLCLLSTIIYISSLDCCT